ncbi:MAG: hypothetical protein AAGJ84_05715, partial [Pseudomonadota bacterium]
SISSTITDLDRALLFDPQTSGGLLFAVDADLASDVESAFRSAGEPFWMIGAVIEGPAGMLEVD